MVYYWHCNGGNDKRIMLSVRTNICKNQTIDFNRYYVYVYMCIYIHTVHVKI